MQGGFSTPEDRADGRSQCLESSQGRKGDAGQDQPILDGSRSGLIRQKA